MNLFMKIFTIKNKKEEEKVLECLGSVAKQIYDARREEVLDNLENDLQKTIFLDWWYGGSLWSGEFDEKGNNQRAKRYRYVNEHDWRVANDWILETVSLGMG